MRKILCITVIACHMLMVTLPCLPSPLVGEMVIKKIKNTTIIANMGSIQGITPNSIFLIVKKGPDGQKIVGKAKVLLVEENISGLKVIELEPATQIEIGDLLIPASSLDSQEENIFSKVQEMDNVSLKGSQKIDYYQRGEETAQQEYGGGGATAGGLLAGASLGLIGWGIGYLIVSNKSADVPRRHINSLEPQPKMEFSAGYKDYVKKKRNSSFNVGAGIGTLIAIVIVVSANSQ